MDKENFYNDCAAVVSSVLGVANNMGEDDRPFLFVRARDDGALIFAFADHWRHEAAGDFPEDSIKGFSMKASGYMAMHDNVLAQKTLMEILSDSGRSWESLGMGKKQGVLYETGAIEQIIKGKGLCDMETWRERFGETRRRNPPSVTMTLKLTENGDGTWRAEARGGLETGLWDKMAFKAAIAPKVTEISQIRELLITAMAEITPWIKGPEAMERILEREDIEVEADTDYLAPAHSWPEEEECPTVKRAKEMLAERDDWRPAFGPGLAFA